VGAFFPGRGSNVDPDNADDSCHLSATPRLGRATTTVKTIRAIGPIVMIAVAAQPPKTLPAATAHRIRAFGATAMFGALNSVLRAS
jgi:hypothetical protein